MNMLAASTTISAPACLHKQRPNLSAARSAFFRQSCLLHQQPSLRACQRSAVPRSKVYVTRCQRQQQKPVQRANRSYTPEIVTEEEQLPTWKRVAGFLLRSTAVAALAFALTFGSVLSADAASSGGRMGGSSFGAARSGGSSMGSSFGGSSGGSRSYGGGSLGSGMGSAPRLGGSGYSSFLGPGIAGGYGYGYGGGFGGPVVVQRSDGGGGLITILVVVAAFLLVTSAASQFLNGGDGEGSSGSGRATVAKLQVGLLGSARSLQRDLERIAGRADTNTPDGLHYVLQETVLSLLRNPDYCVYGDGATKNPRGLDAAEEAFNEVVMEERGKFKEETLVNVGGRSRRSSLKSRSNEMSELIVVTLVVASEGGVKVPKVSSREELKTALNKLGALRSEQILAVEVMWTPQDENDSYTRDELFLDYPTLNTL